MKKKITINVLVLLVLGVVAGFGYYYKGVFKVGTAEPPEDVVKKFYSYIHEGGSSSLSAAYKLISTKHYTLTEDKFKGIVLNYPGSMEVKVIGHRVIKDSAVVSIEYKIPSAFGGDFTAVTEVNLDLDDKTNNWKIDFTAETASTDGGRA